jgi:carbon monoxide dehydrogenase subunit G
MQWTESIDIDRPADVVQAAIADEHVLMQWFAWPAATGFTCAVDGDGRSIGSEIVFRGGKGREQGRQRLARVEHRLRNRGPGGREMTPEVDFRVGPAGTGRARVHLDFRGQAPLPPGLRQLAEALIGRRVRALHVEDLRLLERHLEAA